MTTAAQCSWSHALADGRPATSTRTTGVPVSSDRADELLLHARRSNEARSRNSPLVQSSVRPDLSPITRTATSAAAASLDRLGEPVVRRPDDVAARGERHPRAVACP